MSTTRPTGRKAKAERPPLVSDIVAGSKLMYPILPERSSDSAQIDSLLDLAFGSDRTRKTVYRLREGIGHIKPLAFVVRDEDGIVLGSIRYWPVTIGEAATPAIMLGPVAVHPDYQGQGIGRALIRHSLYAATRLNHGLCILVGDKPYYEPFGFVNAADRGMEMPGWVERERFQVMELAAGALQGVGGMVGKPAKGSGRKKAAA